ncbi:MAG: hypothetical protein A2Y72_02145 [Chloroflexi bacterium RBG_13_53_26]|nr:MAG: hypothetical protein A2Y72_02145 [Chloroflexi bacterium RBG_13_53_26]
MERTGSSIIIPHDHMKNDTVESWVFMMPVSLPLAGAYVNLNISLQPFSIDSDERVAEIGTAVDVLSARV